jgi:inorganic pyrophosphatase
MIKVSDLITSGAIEFLKKEYTYLAVFCAVFGALIYCTVDLPTDPFPWTTLAFFIGAATSMLCGYIGMRIAVHTNVRTTWSCCDSIDAGFKVAFMGGQVLGFALVGLGLLVLMGLLQFYINA